MEEDKIYIITFLTLSLSLGLITSLHTQAEYSNTEPDNTTLIDEKSERFVSPVEHGENTSRVWRKENFSRQIQWQLETDKIEVMWEVTKHPAENVTDKDLEKAWSLYNSTFENAKKKNWFNLSNAKSDGYYSWDIDQLHYLHDGYLQNNESLNPEKPESLLYAQHPTKGRILVGVMYLTQGPEDSGQQVAGPLSVWHYHLNDKQKCRTYNIIPRNTENCPNGEFSYQGPEMKHVWFINHPDGPFVTSMSLPASRIESPTKMNKTRFKNYAESKYYSKLQGEIK